MPMDSAIVGALSGVGADVDANRQLLVALSQNSDRAGYMMLSGSLSDSVAPAGLVTEPLRVSAQGRLTVGQPVLLGHLGGHPIEALVAALECAP